MNAASPYNAAITALAAVMPSRIAKLPVNAQGYPVPWFSAWIEERGEYDLRVVGPGKLETAWNFNRCWLCGEALGKFRTFVIGPMCTVNRISSEPPCHHDCATFAAIACPFLTRPNMVRNSNDLPPEHREAPGTMIRRNPGSTALWTTRQGKAVPVYHGHLFEIGEPIRVEWFAQGRAATRLEVLESIQSGIPLLEATIEQERPDQRLAARQELDKCIARAMLMIPSD